MKMWTSAPPRESRRKNRPARIGRAASEKVGLRTVGHDAVGVQILTLYFGREIHFAESAIA